MGILCVIVFKDTDRPSGITSAAMPTNTLTGTLTTRSTPSPVLAACSGSSILFPNINTGSRLQTWSQIYHSTVNTVITSHVGGGSGALCTDVMPEQRASTALRNLAKQLPPWKGNQPLTELDMGAVLLEYLRIYECELQMRAFFSPVDAIQEVAAQPRAGIRDGTEPINLVLEQQKRERDMIDAEIALARKTLHRTLRVLSGTDRFTLLDATLECLERASLDLRNSLGLAAEASACLPKAANGRGSLFTLP
jgi:hypothetical protein